MLCELSIPSRFTSLLGQFRVRVESEGACLCMNRRTEHSNLQDNVRVGSLMAFIDIALFAASRGFGAIEAGTAVTLDLSVQFIGAGKVNEPLEAQVDLLRETGRLLFLRGLVEIGRAHV